MTMIERRIAKMVIPEFSYNKWLNNEYPTGSLVHHFERYFIVSFQAHDSMFKSFDLAPDDQVREEVMRFLDAEDDEPSVPTLCPHRSSQETLKS